MKEQVLAVQRMQDYIKKTKQRKSVCPILRGHHCFPHGIPIVCSGIALA